MTPSGGRGDATSAGRAAAPRVLPVDVAQFRPHLMHAGTRVWNQTNCYLDLWIELLHAAGIDPAPAAAVALGTDFDGTQWSFAKFTPEDLRVLYGIEIAELNVWRPVIDHVVEEMARGRLLTVEVDSFWLPDTAGTDYHQAHGKTTIVVNEVDLDTPRIGYFHNDGYFEASGDDVSQLFHLEGRDPRVLVPYVEVIRWDAAHQATPERSTTVFAAHLRRAPDDNPVARLAEQVRADRSWLATAGMDTFHRWSFGVLRQCGSAAELAADACRHAAGLGVGGAGAAATDFAEVAVAAKAAQFRLARVVRGREADLGSLDTMVEHWAAGMAHLRAPG